MSVERKPLIIYPAYINANRTKAEGRRLSKDKCVADPRWQEIRDVLETFQEFQVIPEPNKVYCREVDKESLAFRGRVKVKVIESDCKYRKKDQILELCATMIPKLKSRGKVVTNATSNAENMASSKKKKGKR
ncbi:signal recognition particle 19 kDa protein-like protein [Dinothrombium tinctorium]|uniref:Signal recognition particle 19 kDa protein-like protein n=1 Tax=Dinothrombium tinctorium TaxID=1965070 RepID=A0A3S3QB51_9ACAR|nr:signal recognition particle 19 kDa protein-like protein [Dinothrombium tinctorium]